MKEEMPHRTPAGTQVVVLEAIRDTHHTLLHPPGAVGVITRTPAGTESHFFIRLPNGSEVKLTRSEFEILSHYKNQLGQPKRPSTGSFELSDYVIYQCLVGSRAYGLETEESDTDVRGIYLAPARMQWSLFGAPEQFEDNVNQSCYWELQKFLLMALKANPNILECLYSPVVEKVTPLGTELLAIREKFLSRMVFQTFNGYAMSQFKKIEQDRRNHGTVRWKHAMHLLRLLLTGATALREQRIPVRVEHHQDRLLAIKRGEIAWEQIEAWRHELHLDFQTALASTHLPERPDDEAANQFLIKARQSQVN